MASSGRWPTLLIGLAAILSALSPASAAPAAVTTFLPPYVGAHNGANSETNLSQGCWGQSSLHSAANATAGVGEIGGTFNASSCGPTSDNLALTTVGGTIYLPVNTSVLPAVFRIQVQLITHLEWNATIGKCASSSTVGTICGAAATASVGANIWIVDATTNKQIALAVDPFSSQISAGAYALENCTSNGTCADAFSVCSPTAGCTAASSARVLSGHEAFESLQDYYAVWPRGTVPVPGAHYAFEISYYMGYFSQCRAYGTASQVGCSAVTSGTVRASVTDIVAT